ncbi:Adenine-specific methyltransferase [Streptococcus gallolyticus]|uniref:Adenine-specific methyltransferase n=1 Tax=Streptococcus gallolyticus TaxID=315405 RepID=A0A380JZW0_9STRE|nr:Adenine-specific methyltransferase [Streptococcus gallolyticus]
MKCELYNDHFENAKRYQIPRAQLIIADFHIISATMPMLATLVGTRTEIIRTVKANLQANLSLTQTMT